MGRTTVGDDSTVANRDEAKAVLRSARQQTRAVPRAVRVSRRVREGATGADYLAALIPEEFGGSGRGIGSAVRIECSCVTQAAGRDSHSQSAYGER
jgi:hypothetical protein